MNNDTVVRARINSDVKIEAMNVLKELENCGGARYSCVEKAFENLGI